MCIGCGSPFCYYKRDPEGLNRIIDSLVCIEAKSERKRFMTYQACIRIVYKGRLGRGVRKRVRWCFENITKTTFQLGLWFPNPNCAAAVGFIDAKTLAFLDSTLAMRNITCYACRLLDERFQPFLLLLRSMSFFKSVVIIRSTLLIRFFPRLGKNSFPIINLLPFYELILLF